MREFIQKYGLYIIIVCCVVAISVYFFRKSRNSVNASGLAFFVDEDDNYAESVHPMTELPPLRGKNGTLSVVEAVKVTCDGGKTSKIVYLEKYTPEAQAKLQSLPPGDTQRPTLLTEGLLIRQPNPGSQWIPATAPEAEAIRENVPCPPGATASLFLPR